ncbi:MAG: phosphogluconate dehydrogenase (NAD(+)-dependent, decarboxylating) [Betaproteobacteria bacterium]
MRSCVTSSQSLTTTSCPTFAANSSRFPNTARAILVFPFRREAQITGFVTHSHCAQTPRPGEWPQQAEWRRQMNIGIVGLGRMGASMARRLARKGVRVAAHDVSPVARVAVENEQGLTAHSELKDVIAALPAPRVVWLMLPAGEVTERALEQLTLLLAKGDSLVDGGNALYKDSQRRAAWLAGLGISFVDAGVSGGVWGLDNGYALMLGGTREALARIAPFARLLAPAPDRGWTHCGPAGSGHYVKMIHNGIEYGMMQAYAEGLSMLKAKSEFGLDLAAITETWRHGSVVRSWLLDLIADFLRNERSLDSIKPLVADSGEGRWTAIEAVELGVPAPVMSLALMARFASQGRDDYASKLLAMMRASFGGHAVHSTEDK